MIQSVPLINLRVLPRSILLPVLSDRRQKQIFTVYLSMMQFSISFTSLLQCNVDSILTSIPHLFIFVFFIVSILQAHGLRCTESFRYIETKWRVWTKMENHSALMIFPLKRPVSKSGSCQGAYPEEQFPSARKELDLCNPSSMEHYYLQVYGAKENDEVPPGPETCLTPVSLLRTILIKVAPGLLRSLLTQVSKLISTEPSPVLAVHLVDILYSYCFTLNRTSLLSLI